MARRQPAAHRPVARSGFVPGEGAGFCLLMCERARDRLGIYALARVRSVAVGKETKLIRAARRLLWRGLTAVGEDRGGRLAPPAERVNGLLLRHQR